MSKRFERFDVQWLDSGREPQCPPNPEFPSGVVADLSFGGNPTCTVDLPYPAKRCGAYVVRCERCKRSAALTTAGRPDDPHTVILACRRMPH